MYNLYFKKSKNKIISAVEKPFQTEEELEGCLMNTRDIFSDIFILKRQVNAGRDILDMVGVDKDNNVVIIENKNVIVTESILPQILRYAVWAETNPDSIKAMWLESENRPDNIEIDWDNVEIRIMVIAPSIKLVVPRLLKKINYNVDLIEVKRFTISDGEAILLHKLEEEDIQKPRPVKGQQVYDAKFQKSYRNKKSVDEFFKVVTDIEKIVKNKGWALEKKLNKYYVGFKLGFPLVFGVHWLGTKSFEIFFKIQPNDLKLFNKVCPYNLKYDKNWKQATIKYDDKINIAKLENSFKFAYESLNKGNEA